MLFMYSRCYIFLLCYTTMIAYKVQKVEKTMSNINTFEAQKWFMKLVGDLTDPRELCVCV